MRFVTKTFAIAAILIVGVSGACLCGAEATGDGEKAVYVPREPQLQVFTTGGAGEVSLPFKVGVPSGYPIVAVRVAGHDASMLFDTGGGGALVSNEFRRLVGAPIVANATSTFRGKKYAVTILPDMEVGGACVLKGMSPFVMSINGFRTFCGDDAIAGILTAQVFQRFEIDVDYPGTTITLRDPARATVPEGALSIPVPDCIEAPGCTGATGGPSTGDEYKPFAEVTLGATKVPALLDTCSYNGLILSDWWLAKSELTLKDEKASTGFYATISGGATAVRRGTIEKMQIGPVTVTDVAAVVYPDPRGYDRTVTVGAAFLKHYRMIFNRATGTLYLTGPKEVHEVAPEAKAIDMEEELSKAQIKAGQAAHAGR